MFQRKPQLPVVTSASEVIEGVSVGSWSGPVITACVPGADCWENQCLYLPSTMYVCVVCE